MQAPIVKFIGNCISYLLFLLLYSYVAIFNFTWSLQNSEILLYVWFLILIVDEFREVLIQPSSNLYRKLRDQGGSFYNLLDATLFLLAIASAGLKQFPETFQIARVIFAINAVFLFLRLLRVFHVSWNLGPKLVIFYR